MALYKFKFIRVIRIRRGIPARLTNALKESYIYANECDIKMDLARIPLYAKQV